MALSMLKLRTGVRILFVSNRIDVEFARAFADEDQAIMLLYAPSLAEARHAVVAEDVDAVLIDFDLAKASGCDIRGRLGASSRQIPVLVLLEDNAVVEVNEAIAMGADGFYHKCQLYPWIFYGKDTLPLADAADRP